MMELIKTSLRNLPFVTALISLKGMFVRPSSQNEEADILKKLLSRYDVPSNFVEFGFSGWEFNCASLVEDWEGLLLDGDAYNVKISKTILPKTIQSKQLWITLETLGVIRDFAQNRPLGILSVDVDGNDYWFLEALIDLKPAIIIAEYNSSFGLHPVTVPYDANFDRIKRSPTWPWYDGMTYFYFGTSLGALCHLTGKNGYSLIEVGQSGVNAFFVRNDLLSADDIPLSLAEGYREQFFPDGSRTSDRWKVLEKLPLVNVETGAQTGSSYVAQ